MADELCSVGQPLKAVTCIINHYYYYFTSGIVRIQLPTCMFLILELPPVTFRRMVTWERSRWKRETHINHGENIQIWLRREPQSEITPVFWYYVYIHVTSVKHKALEDQHSCQYLEQKIPHFCLISLPSSNADWRLWMALSWRMKHRMFASHQLKQFCIQD